MIFLLFHIIRRKIYQSVKYDCPNAKKDCETDVVFHIKRGDTNQASGDLKNLLNCIGDPTQKQPYFTIQRTVELGIISDRYLTKYRISGIRTEVPLSADEYKNDFRSKTFDLSVISM